MNWNWNRTDHPHTNRVDAGGEGGELEATPTPAPTWAGR